MSDNIPLNFVLELDLSIDEDNPAIILREKDLLETNEDDHTVVANVEEPVPVPVPQVAPPIQYECKICFVFFETLVIAVPCGHVCMCETCAEVHRSRSENCPICRSVTTDFIRLIYS